MLLSACSSNGTVIEGPDPPLGTFIETGRIRDAAINEASGLALSHREDGRLWTMNDGGSPPDIYALAPDGTMHGSVRLANASNVDWEDMASFEFDGVALLLIADVGDNFAKREHVTLYIVEEPDLSTPEVKTSWQISYQYPDGPQDAEAVAVDASEQLVYVLSKRTIPVKLFSIPLTHTAGAENEVVTAKYLGDVTSIPQPTQDDLDRALAEQNWHWQATAMDFSADGRTAIILTYRAVYLYDRQIGETWLDALQRSPDVFELGSIRGAEAASLSHDHLFVTVEAIRAPLYRIHYRN